MRPHDRLRRSVNLGTKLLLPVSAVFIIFTMGLATFIGYTSLNNLTNVKRDELRRMSRILANNITDMADAADLVARSMEQNERITREVVQLATFGPYYADPASFADPFALADTAFSIEDPEQIFSLQAGLNLVTQLQTVLQTNDLDSISLYLTSPYDLLPGAPPTLTLWLDQDNIVMARHEQKGTGAAPLYYRASTASFQPPDVRDFDISSVYSLPSSVFFADRGFQLVDGDDITAPMLTPLPDATTHTALNRVAGVPVLSTSYTFKVPLPHPQTWERTVVPTGVLVIQQRLDTPRVEGFRRQLGLDVGFAYDGDVLITSLTGTDNTPALTDADTVEVAGEPYYVASQAALPDIGGFSVLVFSPRAEIQALIGQLQRRIAWIAAAVILVGNVIVYLSVRSLITRPLKVLMESTHEIEQGKLGSRVPLQRHDELGELARAFNTMASRLEALVNSLEERISARTRDLQAAIDLSRQITTVLRLEDLLPEVARLTATTYGLHAVAVLVPTDDGDALRVAAGVTWDNRPLPAQTVPLDAPESIAAQAARGRRSVVVNQMANNGGYLAMPETRSELAIPMMLGKRFLGVFDVQSRGPDSFDQDEVNALEVLAKQTAIAVRNAQLFEELREAHAEANQANQAKSAFLASVSHELRTPLNSIINFTEFVKHGMMGPVNDQQVETLGEVTTASEHLLNLINDVLDMSKIESGSLSLYVEDDVDVRGLLHTAIRTAEGLTADRSITVVADVPDDLPRIRADEQRVLQILLNIVSNACKFTREGEIVIRGRTRGDEVELSVQDSGPGIAPGDAVLVFESFKQTHTGIRDGSGTGLGMPISRVLAEAHGGRLWFESEPGHGATFYVVLPVCSDVLEVVE